MFDNHNPSIKLWTDFSFAAISLAYGHILDKPITALRADYNPVNQPSPSTKLTTIETPNDVKDLGDAWQCNIVRRPIRTAAIWLRPQLSTSATDPDTGLFPTRIDWSPPEDDNKVKFGPNWVSFVLLLPALVVSIS